MVKMIEGASTVGVGGLEKAARSGRMDGWVSK